MATVTSQYTTTVETTNYARICRIVVDVFRDILWQVLCCNILPKDLPTELQKNKLLVANYLHGDILTKFCPNTPGTQTIPVPVAKDFDVTALYALLRNLCKRALRPTKGWGKTPDPVDNGLGDDIERVRLVRNSIYGHCGTATINNTYFNSLCSDIKTFAGRFDAFFRIQGIQCDFAKEIVDLLNCPMDEKLQKFYIKQMQEKTVLSDSIKAVGCTVEVVKNDVGSIKDDHQKLKNDTEYVKMTVERIEKKTDSIKADGCTMEVMKMEFGSIKDGLKTLNNNLNNNMADLKIILKTDKNTGVDKTPKDVVCDERNQPVSEQTSTLTKEGVVDKGHSTAETVVISSALVPKDSQDDNQEMIQGKDGRIVLIKLYAKLKSELTRELGMAIVQVLFKGKKCKDMLEEMNVNLRRRCIESLLKRIFFGKLATVSSFLKELKSKCPEMAELLAQTRVTDDDKKKFKQINKSVRGKVKVRVHAGRRSDVNFFQYRPEVVDEINDVLLSRFLLSVNDHSGVTQLSNDPETICFLLETIQLCYLDLESGLHSILEPDIFEDWKKFRDEISESTDQENPGIWQSILQRIPGDARPLVEFIGKSLQMVYDAVERGSIVLKFLAGDNFCIELLKPEAVQRKLRELLEKMYPQPHLVFKDPVHVMVFIKSPKDAGKEEIHFYLETVKDMKEIEGCPSYKERYDRDYMVEEMDPAPLKQWMLEKLQMDKGTKTQLEDTSLWKTFSRRQKMKFLMDIMWRFETGYEMLARYCEENDKFVYNKVFLKDRQWSSKEHPQTDQLTELAYERGGGLQKLFSIWIDFNEDPEEEKLTSDGMQSLDLLSSEKQLSEEDKTLETGTREVVVRGGVVGVRVLGGGVGGCPAEEIQISKSKTG